MTICDICDAGRAATFVERKAPLLRRPLLPFGRRGRKTERNQRGRVTTHSASFGVFWVIEKNRQFDTAMPALREVRRAWVPRIQIRSCVIGWEHYERVQEVQQVKSILLVSVLLILAGEVGECISRRLGLATVA